MSFVVGVLTFLLVVNCAVADSAGADATAEKGRRRGHGVWRRRGGRAVRRGFGQCADQEITKYSDHRFLRAGACCSGWVEGKVYNSSNSRRRSPRQVQQKQQSQTPVIPPPSITPATTPPATPPTNGFVVAAAAGDAGSNAPLPRIKKRRFSKRAGDISLARFLFLKFERPRR